MCGKFYTFDGEAFAYPFVLCVTNFIHRGNTLRNKLAKQIRKASGGNKAQYKEINIKRVVGKDSFGNIVAVYRTSTTVMVSECPRAIYKGAKKWLKREF